MEFENMKIFASIFSLSHNILQGKFEAKLKKIESESDIFLRKKRAAKDKKKLNNLLKSASVSAQKYQNLFKKVLKKESAK